MEKVAFSEIVFLFYFRLLRHNMNEWMENYALTSLNRWITCLPTNDLLWGAASSCARFTTAGCRFFGILMGKWRTTSDKRKLCLKTHSCIEQPCTFITSTTKSEGADVFTPFSLSVCLFVCVLDISISCRRIRTKIGGPVGCVTSTNWFNFGDDPNPDPDTRII